MEVFDKVKRYLHTKQGSLRCILLVVNLIGCIIAFATYIHFTGAGKFYEFISFTGFLIGFPLVAIEIASIKPKNGFFILAELGYAGLWAFFYIIGASVLIKWVTSLPASGALVFFGFVAFAAYAIDVFLIAIHLRKGSHQPDGGNHEGSEQQWQTHPPLPKY